MSNPNPNAPPSNTFSGWISSLFGGNVGPPISSAPGGVAPAPAGASGSGVARGTFGLVTDSHDRLKATPVVVARVAPKVATPGTGSVKSALGAFSSSLNTHQKVLLNRGNYKALAPTLDAHERVLAGRAGLNSKLGFGAASKSAKPAPSAISRPVSHTSTGGTASGTHPATTAAGSGASALSGITGTTEILLIAAGVFILFVLVARRKRR